MEETPAAGRLIVALDLPTPAAAIDLLDRLEPDVSFFKIGWQLFITGDLRELLERLSGKEVFIDLKVPGDIGRTIGAVVEFCAQHEVRFLTLSDSVPPAMLAAAKAARGEHRSPRLLTVPYLSSLGADDLGAAAGGGSLEDYVLGRAAAALESGCDGVIASGDAIGWLRRAHPDAVIVSPGIRPAGSGTDDHKRSTTPAEAIRMGADYLVVGRPICNAADPREAARSIIAEIDGSL
jgi:orotidine-5'-phosphate decarboxylase